MLFLIISYPLQVSVTQENFEVSFSSYPFSPFHNILLCSQDPLKMSSSPTFRIIKKVAPDTLPATENTALKLLLASLGQYSGYLSEGNEVTSDFYNPTLLRTIEPVSAL